MENNNYKIGLRDGIAIGLGYIAVSFAFGIFAVSSGLSPKEAILVSMLNLTSAGQMASLPLLGTSQLALLFISQLVINSRYALMSVSLSQVMSPKIGTPGRLLIGFVNTDEIFAVAVGRGEKLGPKYFLGLAIPPYIGWTVGTALGSFAGQILPELAVTALSMSMYAMFIAILVPASMSSRSTLLAVLFSAALSALFYYLPALSGIPAGLSVVIVALVSALIFAISEPLPEDENEEVAA